MEIQTNAKLMQERITLLQKARGAIKLLAVSKARAIGAYDRALAVTIVKLKNGVEMEMDGVKVLNPQTTIVEKIARGICFIEKINMEEADALYKAEISNMEAIKSELNGLQSLNRYIKDQI